MHYARDGAAFIVVRDEGSGIPKDQEDRIFEPFFTTKPNGSGLGLAIASKIIEQHGGLLTARNAPGKGSHNGSPASCQSRIGMNRNLIVVVDDDSSVRRVLKMQLEEAGYEVALAEDGEEARGIIDERRPKLVITDLRMPCADGMDLLRHISEGAARDHSNHHHRVRHCGHRRCGNEGRGLRLYLQADRL